MISNPSVNILVTVRCLVLEGAAIKDIHCKCLSPTLFGQLMNVLCGIGRNDIIVKAFSLSAAMLKTFSTWLGFQQSGMYCVVWTETTLLSK